MNELLQGEALFAPKKGPEALAIALKGPRLLSERALQGLEIFY